MKVKDLCEKLGLTQLSGCTAESLENEIEGCYIGDLLSWVMGRASENDVWITVMGNINAIAVASLTGCACIVLSEDAVLDADAKAKSDALSIPVLSSSKPAYPLAVGVSELIGK